MTVVINYNKKCHILNTDKLPVHKMKINDSVRNEQYINRNNYMCMYITRF